MTKRLGLLLGSLAVFAACGGGGGGNDNGSCGNSIVDSGEQCDDGNTSSGDGCSASCKIENSGSCGDGTVDVGAGEQCDDGNSVDGDGCSSSCKNETSANCGNGTVDSGEDCDDHNNTNGDGCDASCHTETSAGGGTCASPTVVTFAADPDTADFPNGKVGHAMGDTSTSTDQVASAICSGDDDHGGGKDLQFKFTLTERSDVFIFSALDDDNFDMVFRLGTTACSVTDEVNEYPGADGCTDDDPEEFDYIGLPAGTYFLDVDGYDEDEAGAFDIGIHVVPTGCGDGVHDEFGFEFCDDGDNDPGDGCNARCEVEDGYVCTDDDPSVCTMGTCGNGMIDGTEECDDGGMTPGDGCDATCHTETGFTCDDSEPTVCTPDAGCGDMTINGTEECDDGGTVSGDGCSATCTLEFDVTDTEPNDTTAQTITPVSHRIKGSLSSATDLDAYTFTLAAPARVEIESYTTIEASREGFSEGNENYDCEGDNTDTTLDLYKDAVATPFLMDDDSGDFNDTASAACSYIGANSVDDNLLPMGTYKLVIGNLDTAALARYIIDIRITPMGSTAAAGDLVINEYMANDSDADTNCDGVHGTGSDTTDEFVEIVNKSAKTLDLTGMTLSDAVTVRHTFKATDTTGNMLLAPGKAVVVWGGGHPACSGVTNWFVANASGHSLGLSNTGGDTITLKSADATPVELAKASYTANPTAGISANLNPDVTGTAYALHNTLTGHVGNYSPGKKSDGTAF